MDSVRACCRGLAEQLRGRRSVAGGYHRRVFRTLVATTTAATCGLVGMLSLVAPGGPESVPPDEPPSSTEPGPAGDPPSGPPERRLAELSFVLYMTAELGVDPLGFACSEPMGSGKDAVITCFALVAGERVVIAVTNPSDGTGVFDWNLVSDQAITSGPTSTTGPTTAPTSSTPPVPTSSNPAPPTTTAVAVPPANLSDAAILSYGAGINRAAPARIAEFIDEAEGAISSISTYQWDPATATVTLDLTLEPTMQLDHDRSAWLFVQVLKSHWQRGEPFRLQGATLRPRLVLLVSGSTYVSDFDLMVLVADQLISSEEWAATARPA